MQVDLNNLITEQSNTNTKQIDKLSTLEMLQVINKEDAKVATAVEKTLPNVAKGVDIIAKAIKNGGRLVYIGAGTSGRLGILDASECPPTFNTKAAQIVGIIAGGKPAILSAVENIEDNLAQGELDLKEIKFSAQDVLVGITASGRTPYVVGALQYAKKVGALRIGISCNDNSPVLKNSDIKIAPIVGAEVITGSSRLKAGTAQKLILNMLTTGAMIKLGKVFGNLMVDVQATNSKLIARQEKIVMTATDCSLEIARSTLKLANNRCKLAIVILLTKTSLVQATNLLNIADGNIGQALTNFYKKAI